MKRTLLIARSVPATENVGEIVLRDMLSCDGVTNVALASIVPKEEAARCLSSGLEFHKSFEAPVENTERRFGGLRGKISALVDRVRRYDAEVRKIAEGLRQVLREWKPEQVWVIANSIAVIDAAYLLLDELPQTIVQIWDDPAHLAVQRGLDRWTSQRTQKRFQRLLQRSIRTGVICEGMAAAYQPWLGGSSVIIRHGNSTVAESNRTSVSGGEFRIAFCGAQYAHTAWRTFQGALDILKWRIDRRPVSLHVAGRRVQFESRQPASCIFHGWMEEEEVPDLLASADLLYMPQPFESLSRPLAQLSFPTKLSSYVSSGRPVFIHTPSYGSLTRFSKDHDFGLLCNSNRPEDVATQLARIGDEPGLLQRLAEGSARIGREVLSYACFEAAVRTFLGADSTEVDESREGSPTAALRTAEVEQR